MWPWTWPLTAMRMGAGAVTMACLESREEMPANEWELEMAREEGVKLMPSWGPSKIFGENGVRIRHGTGKVRIGF